MPTVITGGQILTPGYAKNRWYNDLGYIQGRTADKLVDATLAYLTGGASGFGKQSMSASSKNPGTFNFPQGSSSPLEQEQIRNMGGVPTRQGFMSKASYGGQGDVSFKPDERFGLGRSQKGDPVQAALEQQ